MSVVMQQSCLAFEPMRTVDLAAVVAVEQRICTFPWTQGNFADSLSAGYSAWLALEQGALAGYAVMMLALDEAHLLTIGVVAERQRQGIGSRLLDHLYHVARTAGAGRMFLEVRQDNAAGLGLYLGHGFSRIGVRRGYYPASTGREDAMVLARDL